MTVESIRLLIVDDHAVVRSGLQAIMMTFSDIEIVGEASSGASVLEACGKLHPEVILMDLSMPELDGVETTRLIKQRYPHIQILALTSFSGTEKVQAVLQAGAIGYLLKDVSAQDIADAVRKAKAGMPSLSADATLILMQSYSPSRPVPTSLSPSASCKCWNSWPGVSATARLPRIWSSASAPSNFTSAIFSANWAPAVAPKQ